MRSPPFERPSDRATLRSTDYRRLEYDRSWPQQLIASLPRLPISGMQSNLYANVGVVQVRGAVPSTWVNMGVML
eukprot:2696293-Pleurochrysis_carterae.AAC.1